MSAMHRRLTGMSLSLIALLLSGCSVRAAGSAAPDTGGEWVPVWSDEFDGDRIDTAKWSLEANCWGGGNNEQQCYTPRKDDASGANAFVRDGVLHIVARRESFTGPNTPDGSGTTTATLPYTSARLRTKGLQEWTFGRFEIRARLPRGQGSWPAIWMLPTDSPYGTWAASGEIDIMEAVNLGTPSDAPGVASGTPETRVHGTLHYGRVWPGNAHAGTWYTLPNGASPADDFHTYALEWEDGEIRWYVDDVHYATQSARWWYSRYASNGQQVDAPFGAPFDRRSKYHLLLNLAVGGNWAGNVNARGIDATAYPQEMLVDWVRVYRCSASPKTGAGCATRGDSAQMVVPPPGQRRAGVKIDEAK